MTCNEVTIFTHQDWVGEPEGTDAPGDLGDLRVTMRARVASRRDEAINRPELQPQAIRLRIAAVPGSRCPAHVISSSCRQPTYPPTLNFAAIFSRAVSIEFRRDGFAAMDSDEIVSFACEPVRKKSFRQFRGEKCVLGPPVPKRKIVEI